MAFDTYIFLSIYIKVTRCFCLVFFGGGCWFSVGVCSPFFISSVFLCSLSFLFVSSLPVDRFPGSRWARHVPLPDSYHHCGSGCFFCDFSWLGAKPRAMHCAVSTPPPPQFQKIWARKGHRGDRSEVST